MQHPTCKNTRIRSVQDAQRIFLAVQQGLLHMVTRRLDADERLALTSGCVYAWEERGPHSEVTGMGIERFTEGRRWSPSRVRDEFLFYYEKYLPVGEAGQSSVNADRQAPPDWDQLVKQTYSVWVGTDSGRRKWHLTAYFTHQTVDSLKTIDDIPGISNIPIPENMFQSTRISKSRTASSSTSKQAKESTPAPVPRTYAAFPPPPPPPQPTAPIASGSRPAEYYVQEQRSDQTMVRPGVGVGVVGSSQPSRAMNSTGYDNGGVVPDEFVSPSARASSSRYSPEDRDARRQLPSTEPQQRRTSAYHPYARPVSYHHQQQQQQPQASSSSSSSSLIDYDNYRPSRSPRHIRHPSLPVSGTLPSIAYAQQPPSYETSPDPTYNSWSNTSTPPQPLHPQHASEMRTTTPSTEPLLATSPTSTSSSSSSAHSAAYYAVDGRYFEDKMLPPLESIRRRPYKRAPVDDEALRMLQVANKTPPGV